MYSPSLTFERVHSSLKAFTVTQFVSVYRLNDRVDMFIEETCRSLSKVAF